MRLSYYPGCSAHGSGVEQDLSTRAVCQALGIELDELEDWSCCGSSVAHVLGDELSRALGTRNLEIAAHAGRDLLVPCAACFGNLRAARSRQQMSSGAEMQPATNGVDVLAVPQLLASADTLARIATESRDRLAGLTIAPYYGCLLVRPPATTGADDPENPCDLDRIAEACGAEVASWSYKTVCCGGGLLLSHEAVVEKNSLEVVDMARRVGADAIVTACPMCHLNLEMQQYKWRRRQKRTRSSRAPEIPVLYVTELVGLALGLDAVSGWFRRHLIDVQGALQRLEGGHE